MIVASNRKRSFEDAHGRLRVESSTSTIANEKESTRVSYASCRRTEWMREGMGSEGAMSAHRRARVCMRARAALALRRDEERRAHRRHLRRIAEDNKEG